MSDLQRVRRARDHIIAAMQADKGWQKTMTTNQTDAQRDVEWAREWFKHKDSTTMSHRTVGVLLAQIDILAFELKRIAAMAPPDDWEYYQVFDGYIGYQGYGRDDPAYVEEPDTSNNGDMLDFGAAIGRRQAAKIARAVLNDL